LYLHVFNWPADGQLRLPIGNAVKEATVLGQPEHAALSVTASAHGATIALPGEARDPIDTVIVVKIDDPTKIVDLSQSLNLAKDKPVEVSSVWAGREGLLNKSHITDGRLDTSWAAEPTARSGWVTVDLQTEHEVSSIVLSDAPFERTQAFDVEAEVGGEWKKIAEGTTIGEEYQASFPAVKARLFRLNIEKAKDTPTLAEFELFGK